MLKSSTRTHNSRWTSGHCQLDWNDWLERHVVLAYSGHLRNIHNFSFLKSCYFQTIKECAAYPQVQRVYSHLTFVVQEEWASSVENGKTLMRTFSGRERLWAGKWLDHRHATADKSDRELSLFTTLPIIAHQWTPRLQQPVRLPRESLWCTQRDSPGCRCVAYLVTSDEQTR